MINRVVLVGRLTRDPQLRKTQTGLSVATFTVACDRRFGGNGQDRQADFISCVAWRQSADFLGQYAHKGALVGVEGSIQTRNYDNASGQKVYVTEVVCDNVRLLESKSSSESRGQSMGYQPQNNGYNQNSQFGQSNQFNQNNPFGNDSMNNDGFDDFSAGPTLDISSDDLPF